MGSWPELKVRYSVNTGPNINKRQVWARMVSQLIVKSQVGIAWGGKTIWVVQDNLVQYISSTTRLDIYQFLAEHTSEVNMLSFAYHDTDIHPGKGVIQLTMEGLYSGPIKPAGEEIATSSFQDIIQIGTVPPKYALLQKLAAIAPTGIFVIP